MKSVFFDFWHPRCDYNSHAARVYPSPPPDVCRYKDTGGSRDTHTGHTRGTRAHMRTGTRITQTNLTTIQIHQTHNPHDLEDAVREILLRATSRYPNPS
jgi:hypothetical protein